MRCDPRKVKKWVAMVAIAAGCAAMVSFAKVEVTATRQVIHIKGGGAVLADSVSRSDGLVFYETEGISGMFMQADVTSVGSTQIRQRTALLAIVDRHKRQMMHSAGLTGSRIPEIDSRLLIFVIILIGTAIAAKLSARLTSAIAGRIAKPPGAVPTGLVAGTSIRQPENTRESSDIRDIALFFLELFKVQNGLKKEAPGRFSMLTGPTSQKVKGFHLEIKRNSDWMSRRMSIGPLGEETGSKSRCYYVIFDTHMVIKIPPAPVTDIQRYASTIRAGLQVAARVAPIICIVPTVSVVLNKVHKLPYAASLTAAQLEKRYIRLAEAQPALQEYLKIGGCFAFFMELTNNFFLGRVINELNAARSTAGDEIHEAPEVAWDQSAFTTRYGLASLPVFEGLQTLYRQCETDALHIVRTSARHQTVHPFQIKQWFWSCLLGMGVDPHENKLDETQSVRIEETFTTTFRANPGKVNDLMRLLGERRETTVFAKNRRPIENIATNVLTMLDRFKKKQIAIRDLKPDNLFLDANPQKYPVFLNNRSDFSIGVIDVETAVALQPMEDGSLVQPLLGGTPLYATPLQLVANKTLATCFGNTAEILHYQDWFAVIAIIFKTVTGKNLFVRAARTFPETLKILKPGRRRSGPDEATLAAISQTFWSAAVTDVQDGLADHADRLKRLTLRLPESMAPSIRAELERETACLERAIRRHVAYSPLVTGDKNRNFLLEASSETIARQVARWRQNEQVANAHQALAPRMVAFLQNLNRLKRGASEKRTATLALAKVRHEITAHILLEAMFQVVFSAMYRSRWKTLPRSKRISERESAAADNRTVVTAALSEI
jgi:hypothetical protein